ncbi:hypothetical protein QYF61_014219 [Mycteria americana]|uniref:Uncharacterized protein n=1 Tax=Mycteria americana TaxID=33587 RepID=A0AAN7N2F1_MYCAM|nr:hypothetical protein QYF61_014219 [Mycteria americana]
MVGLLDCECTLLAHVQLFSHQYSPKSFSAGLHSITSSSSLYWNRGLPRTRCRTLHLALLNLMRFTQAHFSSLSRSLWMTSRSSSVSTAPLSLVSSANLLRVHSILLSMSLMKILNSTGPTIVHYPLDATIQPIPYPLNSPPIKSVPLQFREKDVIRLLRAPSNLTWNVARDGASTTSLGSLFQCLTTLIVKNVFLKSSLNLPSLSLKPLLLVLSQQALLKSLSPSLL